ncbi:hemerythrin domain-containing protein [Bowmanella dokdonensis]|uniref:Hemerythrin-like domain-containing protein n=1 Tax=Bowmanella dokdonensis TaxID=751969 RepID=A0A939IRH1_9ALTE|nr:hypothetical protein [Bowmanella dokdonensis]MBN7825496.1 hypothetical protein [Bowmanella dokdonensis]
MQQSRYNIYTLIHKALRNRMCQVLTGLGQLDDTDEQEIEQQLLHVEDLLDLCQAHLNHENQFIHQAICHEYPNLQLSTIHDHQEHEYGMRKLRGLISQIRQFYPAHRPTALLQLYRALAQFIAENFEHMQVEELHNAQLLWDKCSDAEIHQLEQNLVAAIAPPLRLRLTLMILTSISFTERHQLIASLRAQMPAKLFQELLDGLKPQLPDSQWQKLSKVLGLAA